MFHKLHLCVSVQLHVSLAAVRHHIDRRAFLKPHKHRLHTNTQRLASETNVGSTYRTHWPISLTVKHLFVRWLSGRLNAAASPPGRYSSTMCHRKSCSCLTRTALTFSSTNPQLHNYFASVKMPPALRLIDVSASDRRSALEQRGFTLFKSEWSCTEIWRFKDDIYIYPPPHTLNHALVRVRIFELINYMQPTNKARSNNHWTVLVKSKSSLGTIH